jgi:hypothetical protein
LKDLLSTDRALVTGVMTTNITSLSQFFELIPVDKIIACIGILITIIVTLYIGKLKSKKLTEEIKYWKKKNGECNGKDVRE